MYMFLVSPHDRIASAFELQGTPEIGVVLPYEDIYIRDRWEDLTLCPWWYRYAPDVDKQVQWWTDVRRFLDIDWFVVPSFYSRTERSHIFIHHRSDGDYLVNSLTDLRYRIDRPSIGGWNKEGIVESARPTNPPDTFEEIDRRVRLPEEVGKEMDLDGRDDFMKALSQGPAKNLYPIAHVSSPLWNCYGLWGFEGLMIRIAERRDLVQYACRRLLLRQLHNIGRCAAMGAKAIWIEECMTDMIHPSIFSELNVPLVAQMAEAIRSYGMKSIYYFCGNPAGKIDALLATNTDALAFEEGKKGFRVDIDDMVDYLSGRRVLLGNIDAVGVLQNGSDDQLRVEVQRQLQAGRRNKSRFILSVGSPVTPLTPPQRVKLYCDIAHQLSAK
jgi:hypothetical protein